MEFVYKINRKLSVYRDAKKGFCLIANKDFFKGLLLDVNPVGFIGFKDLSKKSEFNHYPMYWNDQTDCIAFGSINLLNHSTKPNVSLMRDYDKRLIYMHASTKIKEGEELLIDYDCPLWFKEI